MVAKSKFEEVVNLYKDGLVQEAIAGDDKINKFLSYSSTHYKMPYVQCVCAFTQKPNATAFASFNVWNDVFDRKIIKDRRSVGVFDSRETSGMKYLYDIADTHGNGAVPKHWQLHDEHKNAATEMLKKKYLKNLAGDFNDFDDALSRSIEQESVANEYQINDTEKNRIDIILSVEECSTKIIYERLGLPVEATVIKLYENYSFEKIEDILLISSEVSKSILTDIEKEVKHIEKQKLVERSVEDERQNTNKDRSERTNLSEHSSAGGSRTDIRDREIRTPSEEISDVVLSAGNKKSGQQTKIESNIKEDPRASVRSETSVSGRTEGKNTTSEKGNVNGESAVQSADGRSSRGNDSSGYSLSKTRIRRTKAQMNYARLEKIAPHIFDERYDYQSMKSNGYMDFVVERIYTADINPNRISIAHYGLQNGDLMADPEMELIIDSESKSIKPATFRNDYAGVYQTVYNGDGRKWLPKLDKELTSFLEEWLNNIEGQGHVIYKANYNLDLQAELDREPNFDEFSQEVGFDVDVNPNGELVNKKIYSEKKEQLSFLSNDGVEVDLAEHPLPSSDQLTLDEWERMEEFNNLEHALLGYENDFEIRTYAEDLEAPIINNEEEIKAAFEKGEFVGTLITDDNNQLFNDLAVISKQNSRFKIVDYQETTIDTDKNYVLTDEEYNKIPTGKKARCQANIEAIRTLKISESENRSLRKDEISIIAKYSGWGGIQEAFDERNTSWSKEYLNIEDLLTEDEYVEARATILNAYYTPPVVTKTIYSALDQLGFKGGKILEPSMGTGNFIGTMPIDMRVKSSITGVELDKITGRIAKALYSDVDINIKGFQETKLDDNQFDVVIGNVPFGDYPIYDAAYKKKYLVHDYFFVKALDKVRAGGVIAFVTSSGTMDKLNDSIRTHIDEHADHIGSIRLNEDFFVGTKTTTDIIFLQKRDDVLAKHSSFVELSETNNGVRVNKYFAENPEMIIGKMINRIGRFGEESACISDSDMNIQDKLDIAVKNLSSEIMENNFAGELSQKSASESALLPAPDGTPNYSYVFIHDKLYYNTDDMLEEINVKPTSVKYKRIKDIVKIKDAFKTLLDLEKRNAPDNQLNIARQKLNATYDNFEENETKRVANNKITEVSLISGNVKRDFGLDASYPLVSSLNDKNDDGEIIRAAIFYNRAISPAREIINADTVEEALIYSLSERLSVDIPYMQHLTGKTSAEIITELTGEIFLNPQKADGNNPLFGYETRSEYLSGNVVDKLKVAQIYTKSEKRYSENVAALEKAQPESIKSGDIEVKLGTTWIPLDYYKEFMYEHFNTPINTQDDISIIFNPFTSGYEVTNKGWDNRSSEVTYLYGAGSECPAYRILEDCLNMRNTTVTRTFDGKTEINMKVTTVARQKQEVLNATFKQWIFANPNREEKLVKLYNDTFNNLVSREYDGSKMVFPDQSPNYMLRPHQKNAVARILQEPRTLLAHEVGAGKTPVMVAAGHELKRRNLANKIMYVVPNHLVKQTATEVYKIYPASNLLIIDPDKDMTPAKKDISLARIMTGRYDGIIMAHSSFDRIGISDELKKRMLSKQLSEIEAVSNGLSGRSDTKTSIEKRKKTVTALLDDLNNRGIKSKAINFDDLNIDALFVDESQAYKNAPIVTKLNRVAGKPGRPSGKATSMMAKMDYMDSLPNTKGVWSSGTPVTNSLAELYINQRYLQPQILRERGLHTFDRWVSTFANVESTYELAVEGGDYRVKERLSTFNNVPELITMFKNVADIQTQETLKLPRPELITGKPIIVTIEPSDYVQEYIAELGERADAIRDGNVNPKEDNFLKITSDGRKAALDMRLIDSSIEDTQNNKVDAVVENVHSVWEEYTVDKAAQLIFCDQGVPKKNKDFDVYNDIKTKLIEKGIPEKEIAFIHDYDTPAQKDELFFNVRKGDIRVLIGSTDKMGTGTNVQKRLVATHNVDVPWRPDQEVQRIGRMVRQGNMYKEVSLFRYVTEGSFDAYSWQLIETKNKFISQIMTSKKSTIRTIENVDQKALEYAEIKALATGNPLIRDKMQVEADIQKLLILKQQDDNLLSDLRRSVSKAPNQIEMQENKIVNIKKDIVETLPDDKDNFKIVVDGREYTDKGDGTEMLHQVLCTGVTQHKEIGEYRGYKICAEPTGWLVDHSKCTLDKNHSYEFSTGGSGRGTFTKMNNKINGLADTLAVQEKELERMKTNLKINKEKVSTGSTFKQQDKLNELQTKKRKIDKSLNIKEKKDNMVFEQPEQAVNKEISYER